MTVQELKDALEDYPEYWELQLSCPQIHGATLSNDFNLWCDGDDLFLELKLDKEVCSSGY